MIACAYCGAEVFWSLPQPDDPCLTCGEPIAKPKVEKERYHLDHCRACGRQLDPAGRCPFRGCVVHEPERPITHPSFDPWSRRV